jgi:flagellar export protein FliJ
VKPFQSQIRLHKWQVDEAQRRVAELLRLEERFRADRARLDIELANEQSVAAGSVEASLTYAAFAQRLIERRERLDRSIAEVAEQIDQARDGLRDAFAELKKVELAAEAAETRERRRRDRVSQQQQDEVALGMFRRQAE